MKQHYYIDLIEEYSNVNFYSIHLEGEELSELERFFEKFPVGSEYDEDIDVVISSDLQRAIDSADYTFKGIKDIYHDERIRECNYGDLNGKDSSLVKYEDHINDPFPNGEALKDVEERIKDFYKSCSYYLCMDWCSC